jgi:hypothetical protein
VSRELGSTKGGREDGAMSSGVECQPAGNGVTTEAEESPIVTRKRIEKHCRGIAIVKSCYQVMTSGSRLRRLSVELFVVWKSAVAL